MRTIVSHFWQDNIVHFGKWTTLAGSGYFSKELEQYQFFYSFLPFKNANSLKGLINLQSYIHKDLNFKI